MTILKDQVIRCKATAEERLALQLLAEQEGVRLSEMMRRIVRDAARAAGLWPPLGVRSELNQD